MAQSAWSGKEDSKPQDRSVRERGVEIPSPPLPVSLSPSPCVSLSPSPCVSLASVVA